MNKSALIFAPHADDEIIGCFEVLSKVPGALVVFPESKQIIESYQAQSYFQYSAMLLKDIGFLDLHKYQIFVPDPYFEYHPQHREIGALSYQFRAKGYEVFLYTTNMNAPYIRELSVDSMKAKRESLNICYSDKTSLWQFDHKYFLFEGYCQYK